MATREINLGFDCPHDLCDGWASCTILDVSQPDDGTIRIDVEMSVSQSTFRCNSCGCFFYSGDLDLADEDECSLTDDHDEVLEDLDEEDDDE